MTRRGKNDSVFTVLSSLSLSCRISLERASFSLGPGHAMLTNLRAIYISLADSCLVPADCSMNFQTPLLLFHAGCSLSSRVHARLMKFSLLALIAGPGLSVRCFFQIEDVVKCPARLYTGDLAIDSFGEQGCSFVRQTEPLLHFNCMKFKDF